MTLKKLKLINDKETWFPSPGEMVFDMVIIPNEDNDKAAFRRIPVEGTIPLRDRESKALDIVLFDGYLGEDSTLNVIMGGTERDDLLFFTKSDELTRYRRRFSGNPVNWAGKYTPDDEPNDPEALHDWQVWYEIEVL